MIKNTSDERYIYILPFKGGCCCCCMMKEIELFWCGFKKNTESTHVRRPAPEQEMRR